MDLLFNLPRWQSDLLFAIFLLAVYFIARGINKKLLKNRSPRTTNDPVLFSYFTTGNDLFCADRHELRGVEGGAACSRMVTLPRKGEDPSLVPAGAALILVELSFTSKLHLLAIAKGSKLDQLNPTYSGSVMEKAELEGDFDDYFSIYIEKGQGVQLRYVFDPEAMEYVIDFCRKYHWEIIDDTIYFAAKVGLPDDKTIAEFIAQIRPALIDKVVAVPLDNPLTASSIDKSEKPKPLGKSRFKCPICQQNMDEYRHWHECPSGHGQLILGKFLTDDQIKQEFLAEGGKNQDDEPHQNITCPACGSPMTPVRYGGSKTAIDSCTSCYYRWLDGGELQKILDRPQYF